MQKWETNHNMQIHIHIYDSSIMVESIAMETPMASSACTSGQHLASAGGAEKQLV